MCELLAISSALPTTVSMSLNHFASHGGASDTNRDGWGLVYYSGDDIRSAKQQIAIAASVPLTEEGWEPLPTGTLAVMKDGDIQLRVVG